MIVKPIKCCKNLCQAGAHLYEGMLARLAAHDGFWYLELKPDRNQLSHKAFKKPKRICGHKAALQFKRVPAKCPPKSHASSLTASIQCTDRKFRMVGAGAAQL